MTRLAFIPLLLLVTSTPAQSQCYHSGQLAGSETWDASCVHVISNDVTVASTDTLRLAAGAIVKIEDWKALRVYGTLLALGTPSAPIYLTSLHDDTVGGDTNGNGGATTPGTNNHEWHTLLLQQSSAMLSYATIRWGGRWGWGGGDVVPMIDLNNVSGIAFFSSCVFEQAQSDVVRCRGGSRPSFLATTFRNGAGAAIEVDAASLVPACTSPVFSGNWINGIEIPGGTLATSVVLPQGVAYAVTQDFAVGPGATLTLNPGAVLKIDDWKSLFVDGTLTAGGTSLQPIYLTSLHDDTVGGDTNGNGGATTPGTNNHEWHRLDFRAQGQGDLQHVIIRWGGRWGWGGGDLTPMVGVRGARSVSISQSVLEYAQSDAILCQGGARPRLRDTTIRFSGLATDPNSDTGAAIEVDTASLVPDCSGLTLESNDLNGIEIPGGTIAGDARLLDMGVTYAITGDLTVAPNVTLELFSGVIVKIADWKNVYVDGTLWGHGWSPIYITSLHDDTVGGDTNGNGGATTPGTNNHRWHQLYFRTQGHVQLSRTIIRWGGRWGWGGGDVNPMVRLSGSGNIGELRHCNLELYETVGIDVTAPVASFVLAECNLSGDASNFALRYAGGATIAATGNWWGSSSGPLDDSTGPPDYNPGGTGRRVSDQVAYRPWMETPIPFPNPTDTPETAASMPERTALHPVFPNPFNPSVTVPFDVATPCKIRLEVVDAAGRIVRHLMTGPVSSGRHTRRWDGRDDHGNTTASGVYFVRLTTPERTESRRMAFLK